MTLALFVHATTLTLSDSIAGTTMPHILTKKLCIGDGPSMLPCNCTADMLYGAAKATPEVLLLMKSNF
jgi:hypothetical protein